MFEKVNPGHPDKVADRIAGALVDLAYAEDSRPRIAVEVLVGHGVCHIIAETSVKLDVGEVGRAVHRIAGDVMLDYKEVPQDAHLARNQHDRMRCGDNGIFKGVPVTNEQRRLSDMVRDLYAQCPHDGKYVLDGGKLIACQSNWDTGMLTRLLEGSFDEVVVNPLGDWTGGLDADSGATNRKLGSDMGDAVTGGGLCVSGETEYFGDDMQWHRMDEYDGGRVAQWNNGLMEFVIPSRYIHNESDDLIYIHNDSKLSMCLTPYHQMLIKTSKGNLVKRDAGKIASKLSEFKGNSGFVPHAFRYCGMLDSSRYENENAMRLQVAFCADGTIVGGSNKYTGRIRVKKQHKVERLRMLLSGVEHKETKDGDFFIFWVNPTLTSKSLRECFSGEDLSVVYDELFKWDGSEILRVFRTTHKDDADFAQFVIASQGHVATISVDDRVGQAHRVGDGVYMRKSILYTVHELKSTQTALRSKKNGKGRIDVEYIEGKAPSYCFEVPSHNLILRHNDRIFITGNCGKDCSKADVSVNVYAHLKAQELGREVAYCCAIGDEEVGGVPYDEMVEAAMNYIRSLGGFEALAEWGLV